MKKLLAIVLALVLALSMTAVAFAAENTDRSPNPTISVEKGTDLTDDNNSAKAEVWVLIDESKLPEDPTDVDPDGDDVVYNVAINATGADFEYEFNANYNPATHKYEGGSWTKDTGTIVVTNNSNTSITVTAKWENGGTKNDVAASLTDENTAVTLPSAVNKAVGDTTLDKTYTVAVTNPTTTTPSTFDNFLLDNVVITIAGTNPTP